MRGFVCFRGLGPWVRSSPGWMASDECANITFFRVWTGHGPCTRDNGARPHRQRAPAVSRRRESGALLLASHFSLRGVWRTQLPSSALLALQHLRLPGLRVALSTRFHRHSTATRAQGRMYWSTWNVRWASILRLHSRARGAFPNCTCSTQLNSCASTDETGFNSPSSLRRSRG